MHSIAMRTIETHMGEFVSVDDLLVFIDQYADNLSRSATLTEHETRVAVDLLANVKIFLRSLTQE